MNYPLKDVNEKNIKDHQLREMLHRKLRSSKHKLVLISLTAPKVGCTGRLDTKDDAVTLMADKTIKEMMHLIAKHYNIEITEL